MQCRKRSLRNFLLTTNNVNTCNKPKNAPDLIDAVYRYCLVQLKIVFWPPDSLLWFWMVQCFAACTACTDSVRRNKNNNFLHCFLPPHLPIITFTQCHLKSVLVWFGLIGYHIALFFKQGKEKTSWQTCSYVVFCLVIIPFNQSKNNDFLEPRTGRFWGLVDFEAKAKDFKMCPWGRSRGLGPPRGLHLW